MKRKKAQVLQVDTKILKFFIKNLRHLKFKKKLLLENEQKLTSP